VEAETADQRPHRRFRVSAGPVPADEYSVLATSNLNGDIYPTRVRLRLAASAWRPVPILAMGFGVFEATHGTAPKYADKDVINPGSVMLSGAMMFEFLGWKEAATLIEDGIARTIQQKRVTYDLERLMPGATKSGNFGVRIGHH